MIYESDSIPIYNDPDFGIAPKTTLWQKTKLYLHLASLPFALVFIIPRVLFAMTYALYKFFGNMEENVEAAERKYESKEDKYKFSYNQIRAVEKQTERPEICHIKVNTHGLRALYGAIDQYLTRDPKNRTQTFYSRLLLGREVREGEPGYHLHFDEFGDTVSELQLGISDRKMIWFPTPRTIYCRKDVWITLCLKIRELDSLGPGHSLVLSRDEELCENDSRGQLILELVG